ncbi:uncharacterized protein YcbX [Leucobacter exalbidus]|uniref:Uncharacterized protein YcbX n=1 Tax=Leucobacter exalbidus TaxID=662960 RepID=A0A940PQW0_9MICO|nr:MOSC domain-containing protein [Leucobacter exalbidus]MBP1325093.1 uncharacterized protein YcbX [Leucobacter exalbidus]
MANVVALYRYPVKGFTPEAVDSLTILPDGRVRGDRVLAFRFGNAAVPEDRNGLDYWPKSKGLALQDFPSLAPLRLTFDESAQRVTVRLGADTLVEAALDEAGRALLSDALATFVLESGEGRKLTREGRLPLALVGDGVQSRFQDRARGFVSVHSEASVQALGDALGMPIDDRRFRSNIVVEGLSPNEELSWTGPIRIGDVEFAPQGAIARCLATHANPDTGVRDARVLTTLTGVLGMAEPQLGRLLLPAGVSEDGAVPGALDTGFSGGVIRIGDTVSAV